MVRNHPLSAKSSTHAPRPLSTVDAQLLCAIVEDATQQLAVLGGITGTDAMEHQQEVSEMVGQEIGRILRDQRNLEARYQKLIAQKGASGAAGKGNSTGSSQSETEIELKDVARELQKSTLALARNLKQNPSVAENLLKIQSERFALQALMGQTLKELSIPSGPRFDTLLEFVKAEREKKLSLQQTIAREREANANVRKLLKDVQEEKKAKEQDKIQRTEMISHLKDQLQEMRAKTGMESRYIAKESAVHVQCVKRRFAEKEMELEEEKALLVKKLELERQVNADIEDYLKRHFHKQEGQIQHWMAKYDADLEAKHHELEAVKSQRSQDLAKLEEMTDTYNEMERVAEDDMKKKEEAKAQKIWEEKKARCAIKMQAWWRGTAARRELSKAKNKKKGSKSAKGSGKKKKKK